MASKEASSKVRAFMFPSWKWSCGLDWARSWAILMASGEMSMAT